MADPTPTPEGAGGNEQSPAVRPKAVPLSVRGADDVRADAEGGFLRELLAPVAGFGTTFLQQFKKNPTEEYPEEKRPTQPRYHGRHQLNRHPDGLEKCVGCELCAWACPADAILVEGADNDDTPESEGGTGRYSPGERYGRVYQINYLRCIFCGLCIEACPTRALTMTNFYELADHTREDLIFEKDQLLAPLQEGMIPAPHPMVEGMEERDYYQGKVAKATPEQEEFARRRGEVPDTAGTQDTAESMGSQSEPEPGAGTPRDGEFSPNAHPHGLTEGGTRR